MERKYFKPRIWSWRGNVNCADYSLMNCLLELGDEEMAFHVDENASKHPFQGKINGLIYPRWVYEVTEGKYNGRFFCDINIYDYQEEYHKFLEGLKLKETLRKAMGEAFTWGLQKMLFESPQYKGRGPFIQGYESPKTSKGHAVVMREDGLIIDNGLVKKEFAFPRYYKSKQVVLELSSEQNL